MADITFMADGVQRSGYLSIPASGRGRGVLVLHAWWGLIDTFKSLCDELAKNGYVAFAPDFFAGKTASTAAEAQALVTQTESPDQQPATQATAEAALAYLQNHPAVQGEKVGAVAFSFGAWYAVLLDQLHPEAFAGIVLFYGMAGADLSGSSARFLCHFAEQDDFEPLENVKQMKAANADINVYPGTGHWFFESDRPEAYDPEAAALAWQRTLAFLDETLPG
jgi:carboxymethylenebutenolidase